MRYLLDSNIVIAASLVIADRLRERLSACDERELATSAVVYAEVIHGSRRDKPSLIDRLKLLLEKVSILSFDEAAATAYAALLFEHASFDRLIAAHALPLDLTVVTHNERHFADVPGLRIENWLDA